MRAIHRLCSAVLAAGIGVAAIAPAMANSIFLQIPGVTGPVTNSGFQGDIELSAYSQGFTDPATSVTGGGGRGFGRTTCGAISIIKRVDSTSTDFLQYVTRGELIHHATIYFVGAAGATTTADAHYTIVLTNVRVTSITQGDTVSNASGLGITENISMIAEKFQFTYRTVGVDGGPGNVETYGWDCATNRPL
jgi:type VI protein secretion system component Hcp